MIHLLSPHATRTNLAQLKPEQQPLAEELVARFASATGTIDRERLCELMRAYQKPAGGGDEVFDASLYKILSPKKNHSPGSNYCVFTKQRTHGEVVRPFFPGWLTEPAVPFYLDGCATLVITSRQLPFAVIGFRGISDQAVHLVQMQGLPELKHLGERNPKELPEVKNLSFYSFLFHVAAETAAKLGFEALIVRGATNCPWAAMKSRPTGGNKRNFLKMVYDRTALRAGALPTGDGDFLFPLKAVKDLFHKRLEGGAELTFPPVETSSPVTSARSTPPSASEPPAPPPTVDPLASKPVVANRTSIKNLKKLGLVPRDLRNFKRDCRRP